MAELVGDAYVRVHADTRFMARAIRRDMQKNGEEGAQSLLKSFDKTLRKEADSQLKGAQQELARAIVGKDFDAMLRKSGKSIEDFTNDIEKDLRRIAGRGGFKDLDVALESLSGWAEKATVARAVRQDADAFDEAWAAANRANKSFDEYNRKVDRATQDLRKLNLDATRHDMRELAKAIKAADDEWDRAHVAALKVNEEFDKTHRRHLPLLARRLGEGDSALHRMLTTVDKFDAGGGIGKIFGKGSRNDFFNLLGSAVGGMANLAEEVIKFPFRVVDQIAVAFGKMGKAAEGGGGAGGALGSLAAGAGAAAEVAVPALIAITLGVAALSTALPILASTVSLALGGLTAIAGALSFAIIGALLPAAAVLPALLAGFAAAAIAIKVAGDKGTEAEEAWSKVVWHWNQMVDDFDAGATKIITSVNKFLGPFITSFIQPLLAQVLGVLDTVVKDFDKTINDPVIKGFLDIWETALPVALQNVGDGINNLVVGLIAFFTPLLGDAATLTGNFEDLTQRFLDWSKSAEGQNSIKDFMDDAWESANSLWDIIGNIAGAIAATFGAGQQEAGQPFLDWLDDVTARWEAWAESVGGQEALKQWFTDAKEAGDKLFKVIGDIFTFFQTLDTEQGRKDLADILSLMQTIGGTAHDVATIVTWLDAFFNVLNNGGPGAVTVLGLLTGAFSAFSGFLSALPGTLAAIGERIYHYMTHPWELVYDVLFGHSIIPDILNGFSSLLPRIPGIITGALATVVSLFTSPFTNSKSAISRALSDIGGTIGSVAGGFSGILGRALSGVGSAITHPFSAARDVVAGIMRDIETLVGRIPGIESAARAAVDTVRTIVQGAVTLYNKLPGVPDIHMAAGGVTNGPSTVGENGRELVIPLERPLPMVNPAVRGLAEFFRENTGGKNVTMNVMVPNTDPRLAAQAVLDRLVTEL